MKFPNKPAGARGMAGATEVVRLSAFGVLALLCLLGIYIDLLGPWQVGLIGLLVINIPIYMLPTIIACYRGHPNAVAVAILNGLLGWTGLGWLAALVWSFGRQSPTSWPGLH